MNRRDFLSVASTGVALGALPLPVRAQPARRMRVVALGQALIKHDLRTFPYEDLAAFPKLFSAADICFSDLEISIKGPRAGVPTRGTTSEFTHYAQPAVLDCLKSLSINVLAMSNNHAFDLNTGGILDALDEVRARGYTQAGAGRNLDEAVMPGFRDTANGTFAVVSFATGMIRPGGAATATRPGVNEIRRPAPDVLDDEDVERNLASIRTAAAKAAVVLVYHHNHYWEPDFANTPAWQQVLARRCIDNGATLFVSHGAPLLHGIEIYRRRPIFYGLGSFIFHTVTKIGYYRPAVWESAIADCTFASGELASLRFVPVTLNEHGLAPENHLQTRGRPSFARGEDAARILARVEALCAPYGARITVRDGVGLIG